MTDKGPAEEQPTSKGEDRTLYRDILQCVCTCGGCVWGGGNMQVQSAIVCVGFCFCL